MDSRSAEAVIDATVIDAFGALDCHAIEGGIHGTWMMPRANEPGGQWSVIRNRWSPGTERRYLPGRLRRVLVAGEEPAVRMSLQKLLGAWGFEVVLAKDGRQALRLLEQQRPPDLAILSRTLPEIGGVEISRRMSAHAREYSPYIFILARRGGEREMVGALESGADDFLIAPFGKRELRARLIAAERILSRRDGLIRSRDEFRRQAMKDDLTGIWNRGAILGVLAYEISRAQGTARSTGILMLDLDYFKSVNDTYGHLAGDLVLRETGRRLSRTLRAYDSIGRYGGEEFLIVAPGCNEVEIRELAERLRAEIESDTIRVGAAEIHVTASIGAAIAPAKEGLASRALAAADLALYQAKKMGRNRTVLRESWFVSLREQGSEAAREQESRAGTT